MSDARSVAPFRARDWIFVGLMLALMALCVALGFWQVQRLAEKERLIASVAERMTLPPAELPPVADWQALQPDAWEYRAVSVTGTYRPADTVLVFTSLADQQGAHGGPGYWVMTPLQLAEGGVVFINRGFIPQQAAGDFSAGGAVAAGAVTLAGVARVPEASGGFTPAADPANRIDWVRDPARLAANLDLGGVPVAPLTIDLPAGTAGELPQGGETVLSFPNNHLGYALTWFGFAAIIPFLLVFWFVRQRAPRPQP